MTDIEKVRLDRSEEKRLAAQQAFDLSVPQAERNLRGQFATPRPLAEAMVELAHELFPDISPVRFLDPALGTGAFFSALIKHVGPEIITSATGFELDERLGTIAKRLWEPFGLKVKSNDFTQASPEGLDNEKPNFIICNPPYVRHHYLGKPAKAALKRSVQRMGLNINGLAGLYCYFVLLADEWVQNKGGSVWIIPAEFLDVNYGSVLKRYLVERVTTLRIHRFHSSNVQFDDALVTSVILAFRKSPPPPNHKILFTAGRDLLHPEFSRPISLGALDIQEKWRGLFTLGKPRVHSANYRRLADFFYIKRGLATGANNFFILKEGEARTLELPDQFLRPILPSHRLITNDLIQGDDKGFPIGLPRLVLIDCTLPTAVVAEQFPSLHRYFLRGEREHLHNRYLLHSRSPWYSQERRSPAPILCTYMGRKKKNGRSFRFIRNLSRATAANVYLLLYPKPALTEAMRHDASILDRIFCYLQSIPDVDLAGRVYGGGLHKLEPKELGQIELPGELVDLANDSDRGSSSVVNQRNFLFTPS